MKKLLLAGALGLLLLLPACSTPFTTVSADKVFGVAATPEARQTRFALIVGLSMEILTRGALASDNKGTISDYYDRFRVIRQELLDARASGPGFRDLKTAEAIQDISRLTQSTLAGWVKQLIVSAGAVSTEDAVNAGADFLWRSGLAQVAIAAIIAAQKDVDADPSRLQSYLDEVDAQLAAQELKLKAAIGGS